LDSAYDFRLMCLDTNSILKKKLLTMTHVAEVKQYLNNLESSSGLSKVGNILHNHSEVFISVCKENNLCIVLLKRWQCLLQ